MSKTLAPLFLVPFFIDLKRNANVRFLVYADDVLVVARSKHDLEQVYIDCTNHLHALGLQLNLGKLEQGRFADSVLNFCGFRFAGGAVSVSQAKIEAFKVRIGAFCNHKFKAFNERAFVKSLNAKIAAFAHYYKYGKVVGLYQELDAFIRAQVRGTYKQHGLVYPSNSYLSALGLFDMSLALKGVSKGILSVKSYERVKSEQKKRKEHDTTIETQVLAYFEHFDQQNKTMIDLLKKMNVILNEMNEYLRAA